MAKYLPCNPSLTSDIKFCDWKYRYYALGQAEENRLLPEGHSPQGSPIVKPTQDFKVWAECFE